MNLDTVHNVYFIGIGGIGMSNLARYFHMNGKNVAGYDKTPSDVTEMLSELNIPVHFEDSIAKISEEFKNPENTLVVFTPAVPKTHAELNFFKNEGFQVCKRAEVLGFITKNSFCLAVAGTHGKTTTTAILGHLLYESGASVTAFLGGISENYNTNFISSGTEYSVVEADEYDRSFLQLSPDVACITSVEADHLDIYGDEQGIVDSFKEFTTKIKPGGKLFVKSGLALSGYTYGLEDDSDYCIKNITIQNGAYCFDLVTPIETFSGVEFNKPGKHNLLNALVAFAMATQIKSPKTGRLVNALKTFKGVKRRFTYQIQKENLVYVDDYAHHPTEIAALHQAVREMYPGKKVTLVFQPHLFSRTKDFADEFARELSKFDEVLLLDIYPAREEPIAGITSQWLLSKIENDCKKVVFKEELISILKEKELEVLVTAGAGDIGNEVSRIKKAFA
ncbi:UDP-N-acetylmuramate--L-alanine ligase [Pustulibacterium marinum]|uniref:UDP-N-acetylmuramate--L-alanine ligase n=1 Tax=Pustulibacterium marinum TaxID=1224947 RepID=A0A1I7GLP3_9FLAO|nr:UDP-N-acetylmuramate--L-alanine ligase [Pustulibacterium marinum]SFU49368.1 UDP-N-acetylmuramate--L-alanine ligase [Pustulibacterium marinum]